MRRSITFIEKAVELIDGCALVVTTQQEEVLWVFDLVCEQEADALDRLLASIDVVPQEQIIGGGWEAAELEDAQQVWVLTVYIAANLDGSSKLEQYWLFQEYVSRLCAEPPQLEFLELDFFTVLAGQEPLDYAVNIDLLDLLNH